MYFMALATDYDGTLAYDGRVGADVIAALTQIKESGRKLIMVTGRALTDLKQIFDRFDLFDRVVAENGALVYTPQTESRYLLAEPPPAQFIEKLKERGVIPLMTGEVIVATREPQETVVLEVIRDMGLELEIIFNKGAVMILPSGINKAAGLAAALKEIGLSMRDVIGVGDAENDHAFLRAVGLGVALANAPKAVKQTAGWSTQGECGEGVKELIQQLLKDESDLISKAQHTIKVGTDHQGIDIELNSLDRVMIAGKSGGGKSTLATALTEKMVANNFQFCIFDPEGDYEQLEDAIHIGYAKSPPSVEHVMELLQDPTHNVVVNTVGIDLKDRPSFFIQLAPKLASLKASVGRPHWLIIDEAHHLMPAAREGASFPLPKSGTILITVHPEEIWPEALKALNVLVVLGPQAPTILQQVSQVIGESLPGGTPKAPDKDELLIWRRTPTSMIKTINPDKPKQQHKRHTRKYAEGNLDDEFCFYFRGPDNTLNLKAQNLMVFLQMAEGVDDATWMHHLRAKDYSDWFRKHVKDDKMADAAELIEQDESLSPVESRQAIANLVKELYTAPASAKD